MEKRIGESQHRCQKMFDSNMRNEKRLMRLRARIEEMGRYRDSPEQFLSVTGYMNESIQEYILSHNYTFTSDPSAMPDPDNMTYEVFSFQLSNSLIWGTKSVRSRRAFPSNKSNS